MENKILHKAKDGQKFVLYSFVFLFISDVVEFSSSSARLNFSSTYICAFLKLLSIIYLVKFHKLMYLRNSIPKPAYVSFVILMLWNGFMFLHAIQASNGYWDMKFLFLTSSFNLLAPYAIIIGVNFIYMRSLFNFVLKKLYYWGLIAFPLLTITLGTLVYARMLITVSILIPISVFMHKKWFYIVMCIGVITILSGYDIRANVIRILFSFLMVLSYYFKNAISKGVLNLVCTIMFCLPLVFLSLGINGVFNIFKVGNSSQNETFEGNSDVSIDTRTLLYVEVLESMKKHDSFILGEGAAGKYESLLFDMGDGSGRYGAEVGFLNTLLYGGIVGIMLYFSILVIACYYAINKSNNFLAKMLGVIIAGRWVVFFVEDINKYDMNFFFLWIAIGLCLSIKFRNLKNIDLERFFSEVLVGKRGKTMISDSNLAGSAGIR